MARASDPALLDRLLDDGRQELIITVHWDPEAIRARGVQSQDIRRALESLGCRVEFDPLEEFPSSTPTHDAQHSTSARISARRVTQTEVARCEVRFGRSSAPLEDVASRIDFTFGESFTPETTEEVEASLGDFRDRVLRDVSSLLNTMSLESVDRNLSRFPAVRRSVLNYGLRAVVGRRSGMIDSEWLAQRIAEAIRCFEPRLKVRNVHPVGADAEGPVRDFRIEAELVQSSGDERLVLHSRFDAQSSRFELDQVV